MLSHRIQKGKIKYTLEQARFLVAIAAENVKIEVVTVQPAARQQRAAENKIAKKENPS